MSKSHRIQLACRESHCLALPYTPPSVAEVPCLSTKDSIKAAHCYCLFYKLLTNLPIPIRIFCSFLSHKSSSHSNAPKVFKPDAFTFSIHISFTAKAVIMSGTFQTMSYCMPMPIPGKDGQFPTYSPSYFSTSPPECEDSVSSASCVPSYSNSGFTGTQASYEGSSRDYDSTNSASGIDFQEYMQERFSNSFNPIPLDRSVAVQAQT